MPLPGWMFSALRTTAQLAVEVEHVAFAHRACDNLHAPSDHSASARRPVARPERPRLAMSAGRFIQAFSGIAKEHPALASDPAAQPMVAPRQPRRPAAVPAGAWAHQERAARLVRGRGFIEVETSALQVSPGNEAHLSAFATELIGTDGARQRSISTPRPSSPARSCWPRASSGCSRSRRSIATASAGACTTRAFTMLEWYRAGEPYEQLMHDCAAAARASPPRPPAPRVCDLARRVADPLAMPERADGCRGLPRHAGIDLLASLRTARSERVRWQPRPPRVGLRVAPRRHLVRHLQPSPGGDWSNRASATGARPS